MIHFLGYDSYQDLYQGINGMVEKYDLSGRQGTGGA